MRSLKIPLWPVGSPAEKKDYMQFEFFETEDWSDDDGEGEDGSPLLLPQLSQYKKQPQRRGTVSFSNLGQSSVNNICPRITFSNVLVPIIHTYITFNVSILSLGECFVMFRLQKLIVKYIEPCSSVTKLI